MSERPASWTAWGLRIRSAIPLPFAPGAPVVEPDVVVSRGSVPSANGASAGPPCPWESAPGVFRLEVGGVARYLVREGREITVEPAGGDEAALGAFLLGPVMAACLQQRGIVTLHASAVATDAGAVLFTGRSGAGKSVLAATLVERGHHLLADNVAGVVLGAGGHPEVLPAFPEVRLWADAVEALDCQGRTQGRVRIGLGKYRVPAGRFRAEPARVHAVFELAMHNRDEFNVQAVSSVRAFDMLLRSPVGATLVHAPAVHRGHFRTLATLVRKARFGRLTRPAGPCGRLSLRDLADEVEGHLRAPAAGGGRADPPSAASVPTPPRRAPDPGSRGASIVWLASFPRSGNSWLRALLTNYLRGGPASINALMGNWRASGRAAFDRYVGAPSSDLFPEEILRLRPMFHERLAADLPRPTFVRIHDACLGTAAGPLFPRAATAGVVFLVRNPGDVAVSWAHYQQCSPGRAVAQLNRPDFALEGGRWGITGLLPQMVGSWSGHAASWLESGLPLRVVRYEDLLADPLTAFGAILRFAGIEPDSARLARAVEHSRFDRAREEEGRVGYQEAPIGSRFFRSGAAGGWRDALTAEQMRALLEVHGRVMARFGYLEEAEAFLADAERGSRDGAEPEAGNTAGQSGPVREDGVESNPERKLRAKNEVPATRFPV